MFLNSCSKPDVEHNIIDTILFLLAKYATFNIIKIKAELNNWVKASYEAALSSTVSTTTTTTHWTKHTRTLEAVVLLVLTVTSGGSAARLCNRRMLSSTSCKYYQTHIIHSQHIRGELELPHSWLNQTVVFLYMWQNVFT